MADKTPMLLEYLAGADRWVAASELADRLGVSTRSVRSYVTAIKSAARPLDVISSSTVGYRLNRDAYAQYAAGARDDASPDKPRERVAYLVTTLTQTTTGVDVHELAAALFVSESTLEGDLRRVRSMARDAGLELVRSGTVVSLDGTEESQRRLISSIFRDETADGLFDVARLQEAFGVGDLSAFKTDVIALLESLGYAVNEFALDGVLLHTAIAVDRSQHGMNRTMESGPESHPSELVVALSPIVERQFGTLLPVGELETLAALLTTRVGTRAIPDATTGAASTPAVDFSPVETRDLAIVREVLHRAQAEYLVDLDDETLLMRLTMHVRNLVTRSRAGISTRNPLARSIKTSYPLTYELAVFVASELQREFEIVISEDEIAFIALHIGSHLERHAAPVDAVTCTIVCPNYHDMADLLRARLEAALGVELRVDHVVTRTDAPASELTGDLVVSTLPWAARPENVVLVQPFLTPGDIESVRTAVARIRRQRRRGRIKDELLLYFDERLFLRNVGAADEKSMIRALGEPMIALGIIDEPYLDGVLERERLSSTAFTETLAVPHSLTMSARRTAIAVALNETPMPWGEGRVNVIALIAFSAEGRAAFQTVFEQFVDVFSDNADVLRLLRSTTDFTSFIEGVVHLIDS
ncbi:BglG family transcription antiterminator [Naasia lichenicola]|uniref:PRD domain-containing protein n=1 Tax=Naasia lichenicola TaxID=2565933 RepID=A0A4S4FKB7_9MICO|nr:PRD domain-containing protein [Naasia lichenicola]THG29725.1 PRD domain-containing protein [Naasia lichenicola]